MPSRTRVLLATGALVFGALAFVGCPTAQTYLGWTYSLGSYEEGYDIAQTADGGYWALARGRAKGDTTSEPQIIGAKLSAAGKVEWWKLIDGLYAYSVYADSSLGAVVKDGGFVLAGVRENPAATESRLLSVVKLDAQGNEVWNRSYGQKSPQFILPADDGGIVIAGVTTDSPHLTFILQLDASGEIVWGNYLDSMTTYSMTSVLAGGYVLAGGSSGAEAYRVDSEGNQLWWKYYGENWEFHGASPLPDGGFVFAGISTKSGPAVPAIFRIDADGNLLWAAEDIIERATSTHYTVKDSLVDEEGRIVLVGEAEKVEYVGDFFPIITNEGYIMQLDADASLNWYKGLGKGYVNGVTLTDSGDYITAGTTGTHLQVIRVGTDGNVR